MSASYAEYMESEEWQRRRDRYILTHDYACHRCRAHERLQLHHRTYERLGAERDDDLCWLCEVCHSIQHELVGTLDPGPARPYTEAQAQHIGVATRRARLPIVERYVLYRAGPIPAEEITRRAVAIVYRSDV